VLAWYEWDFDRGAAEFRRALALNQSDSETHRAYSTFLTAIGRFDEAVSVGQKALQLDPLSAPASYSLARTLFFAGRTAEAKKALRATLELNDRFPHAYFLSAQISFSEGKTAEAFRLIDRAMAISGRSPLYVTLRGYISARTGDRAGAIAAMNELKARPNYTLPLFLARIHTGLGEHDEALRWLEQCVDDRSESVLWLKVDPSFAPLRTDPRFVDLVKKISTSHAS
jgi:tetratricopeptide (TPR) repeat protein